MTRLLVLTDAEVGGLIDHGVAIQAVESAFVEHGRGRASMPPKLYLDFPKFQGDLRAMPAAIGDRYAGVKLVNSHGNNPSRGLPVVVGTYLLFSQETGMPLCLMAATYLTALRTGAASGVATKYLARENSSRLGLVGAGVQAIHQLRSIRAVLRLSEVLVWGPENDGPRRDALIDVMRKEFPELSVRRAMSVAEAAAADVVCTCTPSRRPVLDLAHVSEGAHINAVGADGPGKQELDHRILGSSLVVVDEMDQAVHGGEVNVAISTGLYRPEQIAATLAQIISGEVPGRTAPDQVTVFDSTGLAIQDFAVATKVYEHALRQGSGSTIDL